MARASTASIRIAQLLLAAVMAFCAWKAWNVPLTPDEAWTYNDFASQPLQQMLGTYDANHHPLHTYLCAISVRVFGVSEFTVRLPALLAGGGYLIAAFLISRRLFGTGLFFLPSIALLSINPIVLDHLSLARGYGFALWFLLLALYWMIDAESNYYRIGIALGLTLASNLSFLFPVVTLLLVFVVTQCDSRWRIWKLIETLLLPCLLIAFLLMVLPLSKSVPGSFYYGARDFGGAVDSLTSQSFERVDGILGALNLSGAEAARWMGLAVLVSAFAALFAIVARWRGERWQFIAIPEADRFLFLAGGCSLLTLAALGLAHRLFGLVYPLVRTGIYFIPLLTLVALALVQRYAPWRAVTVPAAIVAVLCIAQYAAQMDSTNYFEWKGSSGLARVASRIRGMQPPGKVIQIRTSNAINQVLNYYRVLYKWNSWSPVALEPENGPSDFCVLESFDEALVKKLHLTVIYVDKGSGLILTRGPERQNSVARIQESK